MDRHATVSTHALYGEGPGPIAPEFVHIEPISERSSRFEWTIAPHSHPGIFQVLLLQSGGGLLASDGAVSASTTSLRNRQTSVQKQQELLQKRLTDIEQRLLRQYSAVNDNIMKINSGAGAVVSRMG